jgi:hypothetical protein
MNPMPPGQLEVLRERSAELGVEPTPDTLEVNRELLRRAPGDKVASNRLGIALLQLGDYDEAESVLSTCLEAHPDNLIARRRLEEVRRRRTEADARKAERPPAKRAEPASSFWIKALHYHGDGWTVEPGEETWISDSGRRDAAGKRVYRDDGRPWGEPSWTTGHQIGLYFGGTLRIPVLVEVLAPPEFDPERVQGSHPDDPDAGERWPWVTDVRGLYAVSLDDAPTLEDLGIPHQRVQRRPRFTITPDQHDQLVRALS